MFNDWQVTDVIIIYVPGWNELRHSINPNSFLSISFNGLANENDKVLSGVMNGNLTYIGRTDVEMTLPALENGKWL